ICRMAGFLPPDGAREVFASPDFAIAWGNGPATATEVVGGYRLSGRWTFASGIRHATWLGNGTECPVVDEAGNPKRHADGKPRRVILFFPKAAVSVTDVWRVSGLRGTGSDSYTVQDLFVPAAHAAAEEPLEPGPLYVFNTTNVFSVGFASVCLGIARGALDA